MLGWGGGVRGDGPYKSEVSSLIAHLVTIPIAVGFPSVQRRLRREMPSSVTRVPLACSAEATKLRICGGKRFSSTSTQTTVDAWSKALRSIPADTEAEPEGFEDGDPALRRN